MKRILTIQDFSCVGRCSLTAALPVISCAGAEVCGIPTALLSNHTGFDSCYSRDLTEELTPISSQLKSLGLCFDAVYTGYIASPEQMELISGMIDSFRGEDTLVFVDPVMGDGGRMYSALSSDYPRLMRGLCEKADIITPNITEACMLTGREYTPEPPPEELRAMLRELWELCGGHALITGIEREGSIGALGYDGREFRESLAPKSSVVCMGTGDLFASAMLGAVMRGASAARAADIAVSFTAEAARLTANDPDKRFYGVNFEQALPYYIELLDNINKKEK